VTVQTTFNMTPEVHEKLRLHAAAEDRSMKEIMEDALKVYFEAKPVNVVRSTAVREEAAPKAKK